MATPSLPIRKSANVNVSPVNVSGGDNSSVMPQTRSATPFGTIDPGSVYNRTTAPITPTSSPVNDKDAGNGTGNVR